MSQNPLFATIAANVAAVRRRISAAAGRGDRDPAEVRLVAVTKYAPPEAIPALIACGITDLGENRVQQLVERADALPGRLTSAFADSGATSPADAPVHCWHMIGHLQRNKVRPLLRVCRLVQSLDSTRLAGELAREAESECCSVDVFVEVNVAGESQKHGVGPAELPPLLEVLRACPALRLRGFMTMAPLNDDPEAARPHFVRLAALLRQCRDRGDIQADARHLSMGMSQDFEVAVEEGATIVRVGSALFEGVSRDGGD